MAAKGLLGAFVFGLILLLSMPAGAQDTVSASRFEIFGGFSHMNFKPGSSITGLPGQHFNGADGSIAWNPLPQLGLVADFGGFHTGSFAGAGSASAASFLVGPQLTLRSRRVDPFVHALFGVLRIGGSADANFPQSGFAMAWGGGLDVKAKSHLAIRVIQLDYVFSRMAISGLQPTIAGPETPTDQHSFRLAVGVVFRLGPQLSTLPAF